MRDVNGMEIPALQLGTAAHEGEPKWRERLPLIWLIIKSKKTRRTIRCSSRRVIVLNAGTISFIIAAQATRRIGPLPIQCCGIACAERSADGVADLGGGHAARRRMDDLAGRCGDFPQTCPHITVQTEHRFWWRYGRVRGGENRFGGQIQQLLRADIPLKFVT